MKSNKDYLLREIAGDHILVPTGEASQKLNGMIQLSETAAFIWESVDHAKNLQEIIDEVLNEFEVDRETASQDVYGFLRELYIRGMVFDIPEFASEEYETE